MACHEAPPLVFFVRQGSHPTRGLEDPTSEPASRAHAAATRPTQAIPCASNPRAAIRGDTTKRLVLFVTSYKAPEHLGRAVQHFGEFITVILGSASAGRSAGRTDGLAQLSKFSNEVDGNDGFSSARLASVFEHVFGGAHEAIFVFASGTTITFCSLLGLLLLLVICAVIWFQAIEMPQRMSMTHGARFARVAVVNAKVMRLLVLALLTVPSLAGYGLPLPPPSPPPPLPPPDDCLVLPSRRYESSASPSCLVAVAAVNITAGTSTCMAIAMAAVEHSFLCQESTLCKEVAKMTRWDIPMLHTLNFVDVILEIGSFVALLLCVFGGERGMGKTGGPLLLIMLVADFALEIYAVSIAIRVQPTVGTLKNSGCTDQVDADGSSMQETLINLEDMLEDIKRVGYGELFLAVMAGAGDLHEQYRIHVLDAAYYQELSYLKRILLIFLPAVGDAGLAFLDFFVFTAQAEADSERLRESILSSVGAPTTWCLSLADDCLPIIEEDADRTGGKRPEELDEDSVWIAFAVSFGVLLILYLGGIFLYPYLRGVGPFKRPDPTNSKQDRNSKRDRNSKQDRSKRMRPADSNQVRISIERKAAEMRDDDIDNVIAALEREKLERRQVEMTSATA